MKKFGSSSAQAKRAQRLLQRISCVDTPIHGDEAATPPVRLRHGSKFPPSPSGISLYAEEFEKTLDSVATVTRLTFDAVPAVTQQLRRSIQGYAWGIRQSGQEEDVIHVELGGRSLAEFYYVLGMLQRRRHPWMVITCHDVPSVVGSPMLFTFLDRRGLRRLGAWASSTVGRALERRVVCRADTVFTLTHSGSRALADDYGRVVHFLGHVMEDTHAQKHKQPIIYLPGYVSNACRIADIVRIAVKAPPTQSGPWVVVVGAADPMHVSAELRTLSGAERSRITFQGAVEEAELLATFSDAAVVLRIGLQDARANVHAASGPLARAVGRGCVILTDDPRPGVQELEADGLLQISNDPLRALERLLVDLARRPLRSRPTSESAELYGPEAVGRRYWSALRADASAALGTDVVE